MKTQRSSRLARFDHSPTAASRWKDQSPAGCSSIRLSALAGSPPACKGPAMKRARPLIPVAEFVRIRLPNLSVTSRILLQGRGLGPLLALFPNCSLRQAVWEFTPYQARVDRPGSHATVASQLTATLQKSPAHRRNLGRRLTVEGYRAEQAPLPTAGPFRSAHGRYVACRRGPERAGRTRSF